MFIIVSFCISTAFAEGPDSDGSYDQGEYNDEEDNSNQENNSNPENNSNQDSDDDRRSEISSSDDL